MEVLGTAGDSQLGGNDFDARLADWLAAECTARGLDVRRSGSSSGGGAAGVYARAEQRDWALAAAEAAKIALATADATEVALPGGQAADGDSGASLALTQQQFEEVTSDLFQLMANVLEALGEALFIEWAVPPSQAVPGKPSSSSKSSSSGEASSSGEGQQQRQRDKWAPPPRRITQVALVGQVTRLPSVQQFVQRITGGWTVCAVWMTWGSGQSEMLCCGSVLEPTADELQLSEFTRFSCIHVC
jgi:molecular chaperone DnaK